MVSRILEEASLVPRLLPDFISQPGFSPRLRDKIWEWPGDEAMKKQLVCIKLGNHLEGLLQFPS